MPSRGTKFSVGLFVIVGMAMVIIFILWLGMAQYFKGGRKYDIFFDESVQGLNKDSAVKYQGVGIGRVESISVASDGRLVEIVLNLDEPLKDSENMVAQLRSVGITGIMFVELTRKREGEVIRQPRLSFQPQYPVIASKPSEIRQLLTDINEIIDKIKNIDIKKITSLMTDTLGNANQTIQDAQMKRVSGELQEVLGKSREIIESKEWIEIRENIHQASINMNQLIQATGQTLSSVDLALQQHNQALANILKNVQAASDQSKIMIKNGNSLIEDSRFYLSNMDREVLKALQHLEATSKNINQLVQQIQDQPSLLLFSEPPPPKPGE